MATLDVIRSEARAHRTILLTAAKVDGTATRREIEPYSLRPGKDQWVLHYFCLERGAHRSSRVGDLLRAEPTGNSFQPRWPVEL